MIASIHSGTDLVLGSRYIPGGGVENWPWYRRLISKAGGVYTRLCLGLPIQDPTGGFKCFRRSVLTALPLDQVLSNGYAFQIELSYRTWLMGFVIKEIPITFREREEGYSKMSRRILFEAILNVPKLRKYRHQVHVNKHA